MTVTKRALEDDGCETAPEAKKIATAAPLENPSSTLLRSPTQADTTDSMTVTKRALEDGHSEPAPQAKRIATAAAAALSETAISTPLPRSASQADTTDGMTVTKHALEDDHSVKNIATSNFSEDKRLQPYLDRIAELERMVGEYEAFVDREGVSLGMLPVTSLVAYPSLESSVLTLKILGIPERLATIIDLRSNAAAKLASSLKHNIHKAYEKLYEDDGPYISNDDYADELVPFLPDVERLSNLQDGPRFAWNVLLMLVDKSRSDDPGNGCNGNERYSPYDFLDKAMLKVAKARWEDSKMKVGKESKEMLQDATHIAEVAKMLDSYGIKNYLKRTIAFMDTILKMIYPDKGSVKDAGGDDGAGDAKKVYEGKDHAKVENAKPVKSHDKGAGRKAISRSLNREKGDPPVGKIQFGDGTLSMSQAMDRLAKLQRGERVPVIV
ncbi:hypothetical protein MMC15_006996 [Xylographa vitiligo]|nr:hypothetical protein [Xylographa vitiligo]